MNIECKPIRTINKKTKNWTVNHKFQPLIHIYAVNNNNNNNYSEKKLKTIWNREKEISKRNSPIRIKHNTRPNEKRDQQNNNTEKIKKKLQKIKSVKKYNWKNNNKKKKHTHTSFGEIEDSERIDREGGENCEWEFAVEMKRRETYESLRFYSRGFGVSNLVNWSVGATKWAGSGRYIHRPKYLFASGPVYVVLRGLWCHSCD